MVVEAVAAVGDGVARVLLVQMGPLPDACDEIVPAPEETEVVDQGRAEPVVRTRDVPLWMTVVTVTLPA